jgi:hypothetical protein
MLFSWPFSWFISLFTNDYDGPSFWHTMFFEYLAWSAILFPLYYFLMLYLSYKINKKVAPSWVKVLVTFIPLLSATPYATLFLIVFSTIGAVSAV